MFLNRCTQTYAYKFQLDLKGKWCCEYCRYILMLLNELAHSLLLNELSFDPVYSTNKKGQIFHLYF